jgi:hypothetical protein
MSDNTDKKEILAELMETVSKWLDKVIEDVPNVEDGEIAHLHIEGGIVATDDDGKGILQFTAETSIRKLI